MQVAPSSIPPSRCSREECGEKSLISLKANVVTPANLFADFAFVVCVFFIIFRSSMSRASHNLYTIFGIDVHEQNMYRLCRASVVGA